jgi:hypothetical protein
MVGRRTASQIASASALCPKADSQDSLLSVSRLDDSYGRKSSLAQEPISQTPSWEGARGSNLVALYDDSASPARPVVPRGHFPATRCRWIVQRRGWPTEYNLVAGKAQRTGQHCPTGFQSEGIPLANGNPRKLNAMWRSTSALPRGHPQGQREIRSSRIEFLYVRRCTTRRFVLVRRDRLCQSADRVISLSMVHQVHPQ